MVSCKSLIINSLRGKHLKACLVEFTNLQRCKYFLRALSHVVRLQDAKLGSDTILTLPANPSWLQSMHSQWYPFPTVNFWWIFGYSPMSHNLLFMKRLLIKQRSVSIYTKGIYITSVWLEPNSVQQPVGTPGWDNFVWKALQEIEKHFLSLWSNNIRQNRNEAQI